MQLLIAGWRLTNPQIEPRLGNYMSSAQHHLNAGEYVIASEKYQYALSIDPENETAQQGYLFAKILIKLKFSPKALTIEDKNLIDKQKDNLDIMVFEAFTDIKKKREVEAENKLQAAVQARPRFSHAWYGLGVIALSRGNYEQAVEKFLLAVKYNSAIIQHHEKLAQTLTYLGRYEAAQKAYQKAIYLDRRRAPNYVGLAYIASQQENYIGVKKNIGEVMAILNTPSLAKRGANKFHWCFAYIGNCLKTSAEKIEYIESLNTKKN